MTNASFPQNKNGYWSIIVCTMSSRYGRNCSKCPMSVNSIGINVGHQQMAKFLLSILLSFEFSETLKIIFCLVWKFNFEFLSYRTLTAQSVGKCIWEFGNWPMAVYSEVHAMPEDDCFDRFSLPCWALTMARSEFQLMLRNCSNIN